MGGNPAIGFARLTQALGRKESHKTSMRIASALHATIPFGP
jgi:hypothetical protein